MGPIRGTIEGTRHSDSRFVGVGVHSTSTASGEKFYSSALGSQCCISSRLSVLSGSLSSLETFTGAGLGVCCYRMEYVCTIIMQVTTRP